MRAKTCMDALTIAVLGAAPLVLAAGHAGAQLPFENELRVAGASALTAWIKGTRDAAIARGVEEIPPDIREALAGYIDDDILDRVRWRVDDGSLSIEQAVFHFGETPAVTLDDVVLFATRKTALEDPTIWAHELVHVGQYRAWGIAGFAERYLDDYEAVERDAQEFRWQWMKTTGRVPAPAPPQPP
jgi:hypothetical protein